MEIKYQIQFTDIPKIFVEYLYKSMNQLKNNKLILILIHNCNKVQ